jgi:hypothetical protein
MDKDKQPDPEIDEVDVPGSEIPGHLQEEQHSGVEAIFDMGDYALSEEEKIALGIERLELEDLEEPGEPGPPE